MQLPALSPLSPLSLVLADIQKAIEARLYYPALLATLTIPEICVALALDNSVFVKKKHYVDFVDKYTTPRELGLSGESCYRLRGGVVHRANMAGHPKFDATHVIFTLPESRAHTHAFSIVNEQQQKKAAMFDLEMFYKAMDQAARRWYEDHQNDPKVAENMKNLIRYSPIGLSPFLNGVPVVGSGI